MDDIYNQANVLTAYERLMPKLPELFGRPGKNGDYLKQS